MKRQVEASRRAAAPPEVSPSICAFRRLVLMCFDIKPRASLFRARGTRCARRVNAVGTPAQGAHRASAHTGAGRSVRASPHRAFQAGRRVARRGTEMTRRPRSNSTLMPSMPAPEPSRHGMPAPSGGPRSCRTPRLQGLCCGLGRPDTPAFVNEPATLRPCHDCLPWISCITHRKGAAPAHSTELFGFRAAGLVTPSGRGGSGASQRAAPEEKACGIGNPESKRPRRYRRGTAERVMQRSGPVRAWNGSGSSGS